MLWIQPLKRYFEFSGRSSRAEYWQFIAVFAIALAVATFIDLGSERSMRAGMALNAYVVLAAGLIPAYAVTFRRLHDRGMTGWAVGVLWALNIAGLILGKIKDSIDIEILAAPFVLLFWLVLGGQIAWACYMLRELIQPGDPEPNRFGPPPAL